MVKLKYTYAIGCLIQWYEIEMIEEYFQSVRNALDTIKNPKNITIDLYFNRDIRANDYHSLFTEEKGMNWFALIEPTLSDTVIIDSIKLKINVFRGN